MKLGIAGAGFAARFHYECLEKLCSVPVQVTGITSLRPESREKFSREKKLKAYAGFTEMLKEVDAVDLCVPPYVHEELIVQAAEAKKHVIVEKPLTGYFGPKEAGKDFHAGKVPRREMFDLTIASLKRIKAAVEKNRIAFAYAENFVYAPAIRKEREIIEKTGAQLLRMSGEESHSGSHSPFYGIWKYSGGGSLIGKGCHPLSAILYLKRIEGLARNGKPIRPATVSCRTHELTRLPGYRDLGFLRTDYRDIEDFGWMHVVFEDGTVGDVVTSEVVLGGIYSWVDVFANNHRTRCRLSPTDLIETYNPKGEQFKDVYLVEKVSTKEGWSSASPDENWTLGYLAEMEDFLKCFLEKKKPQSDLELAIDTTLAIYAGYLSAENMGREEKIPDID